MKRVTVFLMIVLFAAILSGTVNAQISADVTFNLPVPTGDFADIAEMGYGAGADVFVGLPFMPIKVGGHVGYNSFGAAENFMSGDTKITEIVPSLRYQLGLPFELLSVFLQCGAGMYNWKDDDCDGTDFGISAGAGISARVLLTKSVVVMPLYNIIMAEDENLTYLSLNVGVQF